MIFETAARYVKMDNIQKDLSAGKRGVAMGNDQNSMTAGRRRLRERKGEIYGISGRMAAFRGRR